LGLIAIAAMNTAFAAAIKTMLPAPTYSQLFLQTLQLCKSEVITSAGLF
jgi:hypothetical protein